MNACIALRAALVIVGAIALGGCATSRSELKMTAPITTSTAQPTKGRAVMIRSVHDDRVFEEAPRQASTPSIGLEGTAKATAEVKARAVGRKRNTFGKALGDVLLEPGQTVSGLVRDNLGAAFREAGYRVATDDVSAGDSPLLVDVRIKQFWVWVHPGFWAITLNANIETDLQLADQPTPVRFNTHVEDPRQIVTDAAWLEIAQKALAEWRGQVVARLVAPPF